MAEAEKDKTSKSSASSSSGSPSSSGSATDRPGTETKTEPTGQAVAAPGSLESDEPRDEPGAPGWSPPAKKTQITVEDAQIEVKVEGSPKRSESDQPEDRKDAKAAGFENLSDLNLESLRGISNEASIEHARRRQELDGTPFMDMDAESFRVLQRAVRREAVNR